MNRCLKAVANLFVSFLILIFMAGCESRQASTGFHEGRALLMRGQLERADRMLAQFQKANPTHQLCSRALFLRGKAQLGLGDFDLATAHFLATIKKYPQSEEAHKAKYKLAVLEMLNGNREQAVRQFQEIADNPDGTLVAEAAAMARWLSKEPEGTP